MLGQKLNRTCIAGTSLLVVVSLLFAVVPVYGAQLSSRKITVADSSPSVLTSHRFNFTLPTITPLGSIKFEYCVNNPFVGTTCTPPAGLDLTGAVLSGQTGETGFSIDASSTANTLVITRAAVVPSAIPVSYTFSNLINPNTTNQTVYVRISTYATTDASGPTTDEGAVVFSTASGVTVAGFVPPYLTFCTGVTVAVDCSSSNGSQLNFGSLSTSQPRFLSSEFSGATNDPGGFSTSVTGITMTSGSHIIPALATAQASQPGVSQFGMNLRANSAPPVGSEPLGFGISNSVAQAPFNTQNLFVFKNQIITSSPLPTNFTKFTASYIVNISPAQQPGIYTTTLTYIAVAAF
jgi:hypothetical protein